jgi:hypothetical protein
MEVSLKELTFPESKTLHLQNHPAVAIVVLHELIFHYGVAF